MFRNRIFLKSLAVFLILETLGNVLWPTISYALTAGPTAPEATSFEPVDTTDIVNLSTGDLVYNIPLLEVPGPSGGYPLSLSYHAGIQPNEEASWVGLGWTLNPGAIARNVNGFADDFSNTENLTRYHWSGGKTTTRSIGVSYGIAGTPLTVSSGLSFSHDTYQGSGTGGYVGAGLQFGGENAGVNVGVRVGVSPYGDRYASASAGVGYTSGQFSSSASVNVTTNFKSVESTGSIGVSYGQVSGSLSSDGTVSVSALGLSISTGPNGSTIGIGGASVMHSSRTGVMSVKTRGFSIPIPIYYGISLELGWSKQRYHVDQYEDIKVNGSLHFPRGTSTLETFDHNAYDTYSLLDEDSLLSSSDPEKNLGGSLPNFDNYSVNAQGVGGAIRPYYFQKHLVRKNDYVVKEDDDGDQYNDYSASQYQTGYDLRDAEFRFVGDFSNRFEYEHGDMKYYPNDADHSYHAKPISYDFESGGSPIIGESGTEEYKSNRLPGSRHIDWITNFEIEHSTKRSHIGMIDTRSTGFDRSTLPKDGIGAFIITNETGVKYHFSLPAMAYSEYSYSVNKDKGTSFNESNNPEKYAYTWYLTAVTGPDYVDRGANGIPDGILNEYDWGYWVEFEYGKWTEIYNWRNPAEGYHKDLDTRFRNFSEGRKELYYLDAIRTKSHTALFVKDIRHDAKSTVYAHRNIVNKEGLVRTKYTGPGAGPDFPETLIASSKRSIPKITSYTANGGFAADLMGNTCVRSFAPPAQTDPDLWPQAVQNGSITYTSRPTSSMKLTEVLLVNNSDLQSSTIDKSQGTQLQQSYQYSWNVTNNDNFPEDCDVCDFSPLVFNHHLYQNVLDKYDPNLASIKAKALRVVNFETDYSLSSGTTNSFDFSAVNVASPSDDINSYEKFGKLTLKKLHFLGKGGEAGPNAGLLPPMEFNYDLEKTVSGYSYFKFENTDPKLVYFNESSSSLEKGDILKISSQDKTCYGVVKNIEGQKHSIKIIGDDVPLIPAAPLGISLTWSTTKNPAYNKEAYDIWGLYKSDLNEKLLTLDDDNARLVSEASSKSLDVWSLRTVKTSMGATIDIRYGPDEYKKPILPATQSLTIDQITPKGAGSTNYIVAVYGEFDDLSDLVNAGDLLDCDLLFGDPIGLTFAPRVETKSLEVSAVYKGSDNKWNIEVESLADVFARRDDHGNPVLICGNAAYKEKNNSFGGGVRVESISMKSLGKEKQTLYHYNKEGITSTSGVSSYTPVNLDAVIPKWPTGDQTIFFANEKARDKALAKYRKVHHKNMTKIITNSREVPPPGVLYEFVTVRENFVNEQGESQKGKNYSTFNFEVFNEGHVGVVYEDDFTHSFEQPLSGNLIMSFTGNGGNGYPAYDTIRLRKTRLKNYAMQIGNLKNVTLYDEHGNKVNETINHYLHDEASAEGLTQNDPKIDDKLEANIKLYENLLKDKFKSQGVIEESFSEARFIKQDYKVHVDVGSGVLADLYSYHLLGVLTKREEFPSIQTGQTVINYKSGIKTETKSLAFDFYSGQVTKSESTDGYGNTFITEVTPAYRVYPSMGLASKGGYNMLTQEAGSYSYKVDAVGAKVGLVSAGVQTWSEEIPMLDHSELHESFALSYIEPGEDLFGHETELLEAKSSGTASHLYNGQLIKFINQGAVHYARVVSNGQVPFESNWHYELKVVTDLTLSGRVNNVTCYKLTTPRKHATFSYIGDDNVALSADGLHTLTNGALPAFNAWKKGEITPDYWQKNGEITLYDVQTHALEASDLNNQYAATKMSSDQAHVYATVANSRYDEFAFSGAEDAALANGNFGGGVNSGVGVTDAVLVHTGVKSLKISAANSNGYNFSLSGTFDRNRRYVASVWAHKDSRSNVKLIATDGSTIISETDGATLSERKRAGDWYLLELEVNLSATTGTIQFASKTKDGSTPTYMDDFRVHPFDAAMISYAYNEWGELSHIMDNRSMYTKYVYDAVGRLTRTYKETFVDTDPSKTHGNAGIVKVSEINYNYGAKTPYTITISSSKAGSGTLIRTGDIFGAVSSNGDAQVIQGGDMLVTITNQICSSLRIDKVLLDGKLITLTPASNATLTDGTQIVVTNSSVLFKNVQTQHSLDVSFWTESGSVGCHYTTDENGAECTTGNYQYELVDACGTVTATGVVTSISSLPASLRGQASGLSCSNTCGGEGSGGSGD